MVEGVSDTVKDEDLKREEIESSHTRGCRYDSPVTHTESYWTLFVPTECLSFFFEFDDLL
jgi:hypothetical protein